MTGFVALHRAAFDHSLLQDAQRFRAWFWLVAHAAWRPTKHNARGKTIEIDRGQICAGRDQLAKAWGWSPSAVERFLTRLETEHMIERTSGQIKTVITVCNYDKYQASPEQTGQLSGQICEQKPDRNRTAKEKENKGTREGSIAKAIDPMRAGARSIDRPGDVSPEVWADFVAMRAKMRADISHTVIAGFRREAQLCGWSIEQAMIESIERGWRGFKAKWVTEHDRNHTFAKPSTGQIAKSIADRLGARGDRSGCDDGVSLSRIGPQ